MRTHNPAETGRMKAVSLLISFVAAFYIVFVFNACTTFTHSIYNSDDLQDKPCYDSYQGGHGYCDRNVK